MFVAAIAWFVLSKLASFLWPQVLAVPVPIFARFALAGMFVGAGLAFISRAKTERARANYMNRPAIYGVYSLCRHPVYAAWILCLFPAVVIMSGAWPAIALPLVAWLGYKSGIDREEQALLDQFGESYAAYRANTRELLPLPPRKEGKQGR